MEERESMTNPTKNIKKKNKNLKKLLFSFEIYRIFSNSLQDLYLKYFCMFKKIFIV